MKRWLLFATLLTIVWNLAAQEGAAPESYARAPSETRRHIYVSSQQRGNLSLRERRAYHLPDRDTVRAAFAEALLRAYLKGALPGLFAEEPDSLMATYTLWELLNKSAKTYFASANDEDCLCPEPTEEEIRAAALNALVPGGFELIEDARFDLRAGREIRLIKYIVLHLDHKDSLSAVRLAFAWDDARRLAEQAPWRNPANEVEHFTAAEALENGLARGRVVRAYRKSDGRSMPVSGPESAVSLNEPGAAAY